MAFIGQAWRRFMFLLRRRQLDQDLAEEMRLHAALKAQKNIAVGMDQEEEDRLGYCEESGRDPSLVLSRKRGRRRLGSASPIPPSS